LPVYQLAKSGGNLKLTRVRKLGGELETLRKQLESTLSPKPEYVKINPLTGHIMIKVCLRIVMEVFRHLITPFQGWYKRQIDTFLEAKGF